MRYNNSASCARALEALNKSRFYDDHRIPLVVRFAEKERLKTNKRLQGESGQRMSKSESFLSSELECVDFDCSSSGHSGEAANIGSSPIEKSNSSSEAGDNNGSHKTDVFQVFDLNFTVFLNSADFWNHYAFKKNIICFFKL